MKQATTNFSLKDQLFNRKKVEYIAELISAEYSAFLKGNFIEEVVLKFPELELKQRITHITTTLQKYLPDKYETALEILLESLPVTEENGVLDNNFGDFIFAPFGEYVSEYGCSEGYLHISLKALEKMTSSFSCEYSIRIFINAFPEKTFEKLLEWSRSENYHVRRLASEGSRQKLPWAQNIILDYTFGLQILENLYTDTSRYVTRSVANHLNDISKIDADIVVETLKNWSKKVGYDCNHALQKDGVEKECSLGQTHRSAPTSNTVGVNLCVHPETDINYIISHSTRGLVKQGHKATLEFLGYLPNPQIKFSNFNLENNTVKIGETLNFSFDIFPLLTSPQSRGINLIIDYKIYFLNKAGVLKPKVFKIKKINGLLTEGFSPLQLSKKHKLKLMTTKALYAGEHAVEIIINGKSFGKKRFKLSE